MDDMEGFPEGVEDCQNVVDILPGAGGADEVGNLRRIWNGLLGRNLDFFQNLPGLSVGDKEKLSRLWPKGCIGDLRQGSVGDCYFASGLYGLHLHPLMPYVAAKTIEKERTDDEVSGWNVIFLGGEGEAIHIGRGEDLAGQDVPNKRGRKVYKSPIRGQVGDVILERAFGRDRSVKKSLHDVSRGRQLTMAAIRGGHGFEPLQLMLGDLVTGVDVGWYGENSFSRQNQFQRRRMKDLFQAVSRNPDGYILTANAVSYRETEWWDWVWDEDECRNEKCYYLDKRRFLYPQHAYTLVDVDFDEKKLTVVNPYNTKRLCFRMTFEEFEEFFSNISGVEFDKQKVREMFPRAQIKWGKTPFNRNKVKAIDFSRRPSRWPYVAAGVVGIGVGGWIGYLGDIRGDLRSDFAVVMEDLFRPVSADGKSDGEDGPGVSWVVDKSKESAIASGNGSESGPDGEPLKQRSFKAVMMRFLNLSETIKQWEKDGWVVETSTFWVEMGWLEADEDFDNALVLTDPGTGDSFLIKSLVLRPGKKTLVGEEILRLKGRSRSFKGQKLRSYSFELKVDEFVDVTETLKKWEAEGWEVIERSYERNGELGYILKNSLDGSTFFVRSADLLASDKEFLTGIAL